MSNLADELLSLRFSAGPLQSVYLNDDRVDERFVGHSGAIAAWTRNAANTGSVGIGPTLIHVGGERSAGNEITYDLRDHRARALLLREALQASGVVRLPESATQGQYVLAAGRGCLRHPEQEQLFTAGGELHPNCISEEDQRYAALERDRARIEATRLALAPSNDRMWLLALTEGADIVAAAVLNSRWIDDGYGSYLHSPWLMFGTLRERIAGVPVLAAIHVWVKMADDVMTPLQES